MRLDTTKKYLICRGMIRGLLAAIIGSCLFTLLEATAMILFNGFEGLDDSFFQILPIIFIAGFIFGTPLTIMAGVWLAFDIHKVSKTKPLTIKEVFYKSALLGLQIGIGLAISIVGLYFSRGNWYIILLQAILGMTLCSIIAGLTGVRLLKDIRILNTKLS